MSDTIFSKKTIQVPVVKIQHRKTNMYPHKKRTSSKGMFIFQPLFSGDMFVFRGDDMFKTNLSFVCHVLALFKLDQSLLYKRSAETTTISQLIVTVPPVGFVFQKKHIPTSPTRWTPGYNSTDRG